jgi:ketosteroid isomerase-like protein
MKTDALRINQLSPTVFGWYCRYLDAIDGADVSAQLSFFHEDCALQINNHLPMHGHTAIAAAFERYWEAIASIEHELLNIYGNDERFCVEMLCHYTGNDGSQVILPAAVFIDRSADGLITWARSYIDATPVHDAFTRQYA